MSNTRDERSKTRLRTMPSGHVVLAKAPGWYEVSKRERMQWARENTWSLKNWRKRLAASVLLAALAIGALRVFGSSTGPTDELIVAAATIFGAFCLVPVIEYGFRRIRAGEHVATDKAQQLEIEADQANRERDSLQAELHDRASERYQRLRQAVLPMLNELEHARGSIAAAHGAQRYSNDMVQGLLADEWKEHKGVLAARPELQDTYDMAFAAYKQIDVLNKRVAYRDIEMRNQPGLLYAPTDSPFVDASDALPSVLHAIDEALIRLNGVLALGKSLTKDQP